MKTTRVAMLLVSLIAVQASLVDGRASAVSGALQVWGGLRDAGRVRHRLRCQADCGRSILMIHRKQPETLAPMTPPICKA